MSQSDNRKRRREAHRRIERAAQDGSYQGESVEESHRLVDEVFDQRARNSIVTDDGTEVPPEPLAAGMPEEPMAKGFPDVQPMTDEQAQTELSDAAIAVQVFGGEGFASMPQDRQEFLRGQYERGEIDGAHLRAYVEQYVSAPQTLAPATELDMSEEAISARLRVNEGQPIPGPDGEVEEEQPDALLIRLRDHEGFSDDEKLDLASRYANGRVNASLLSAMLDSADEDLAEQAEEGEQQTAVSDRHPGDEPGATAEEVEQAQLIRASDLLPPAEEEIPPPPSQSLPPPPGEQAGIFSIEKNRFGAGTWGVDIVHPDGTFEPVMVYLAREQPDWSGPQVAQWMIDNGMPQDHAVRLARQRERAQEGVEVTLKTPAVSSLASEEKKHFENKDAFSKAFVEASRKKKA